MSELIPWPEILPQRVTWGQTSNVWASPPSPFTGSTQHIARPGNRWVARFEFKDVPDGKREKLNTFIAAMNGMENYSFIANHGRNRTGELFGSFDNRNHLTWPTSRSFNGGPVGFQGGASAAGGITVSPASSATDVELYGHPNKSLDVTAGQRYTVAFDYVGKGITNTLYTSIAAAATTFATSTLSTETNSSGRHVISVSAPDTGRLLPLIRSNGRHPMILQIHNAVVQRAIETTGGPFLLGQNYVDVTGLTQSTSAELKTNDIVEIGLQMYELASDAYVSDSGVSRIYLSSRLRTDVPALTPVVTHLPRCKMKLTTNSQGSESRPGIRSSFVLDFEEDLS